MIKRIIDFFRYIEQKQDPIDIYIRGAGMQGFLLRREMEALGIKIKAFLDRAYAEITEFDGIAVINPRQVYGTPLGSYFIICSMESDGAYYAVKEEMVLKGLLEGEHFIDLGIPADRRMVIEREFAPPLYRDRKTGHRNAALYNDNLLKGCVGSCEKWNRNRSFGESDIFIGGIDFQITTFCNLKCRDCGHLIPYHTHPAFFDPEQIVGDLDKILSISHVAHVTVMGGEAFLHPKIKDIFMLMSNMKNMNNVDYFCLTTNGTILPADDIMKAFSFLKHSYIKISNYGRLSNNIHKLKELCKTFEIPCVVLPSEVRWIDAGNFSDFRGYSTEEMKHLLNICCSAVVCNALRDGKIYSCPRIATLNESRLIPYDEKAFVNIRNTHINELGTKLKTYMFHTETFSGCQYCDGFYSGAATVKKAIQLSR